MFLPDWLSAPNEIAIGFVSISIAVWTPSMIRLLIRLQENPPGHRRPHLSVIGALSHKRVLDAELLEDLARDGRFRRDRDREQRHVEEL